MSLNEKIKKLPPEEAISVLDEYLVHHQDSEEGYILRGKVHWKAGHRKEAVNDFLYAISLNPDSKAKMLLDYANSILDYYNKDLFNP